MALCGDTSFGALEIHPTLLCFQGEIKPGPFKAEKFDAVILSVIL